MTLADELEALLGQIRQALYDASEIYGAPIQYHDLSSEVADVTDRIVALLRERDEAVALLRDCADASMNEEVWGVSHRAETFITRIDAKTREASGGKRET